MAKYTIFITGGLGFIGSNFVRYIYKKYPNYKTIVLDNASLPGMENNLNDLQIVLEKSDICNFSQMEKLYEKYQPDYMVNFAAQSHNDRAIAEPNSFFETNVLGCQYLLECSRIYGIKKHVHISTIEVYGEQSSDIPYFTEQSPLRAKTPYSCAKAGGDMAVRAYMNTYKMPINITHCANNYGYFQYPEKLIPVMITNLIQGKNIKLYGDGLQKRDWLHVWDHCHAIDLVLHKGADNEIYDISTRNELTNLEIARQVLKYMNLGEEKIEFVADRPNHDKRYLIEPAKIETELGFKAQIDFNQGLQETIDWYVQHQDWWQNITKINKNLTFDWSRKPNQ